MQTQLRAENGIEEIVIGYVCDYDVTTETNAITELPISEVTDLLDSFGAEVVQTTAEGLPENVRSLYLAEMHRMKTGETLPSTAFEALKGE